MIHTNIPVWIQFSPIKNSIQEPVSDQAPASVEMREFVDQPNNLFMPCVPAISETTSFLHR
jgi:hypothetical protein